MKLDDFINEQYGISKLPFQQEQPKVYSPDQGLVAGTMFPSLDKPFYGGKCGDVK